MVARPYDVRKMMADEMNMTPDLSDRRKVSDDGRVARFCNYLHHTFPEGVINYDREAEGFITLTVKAPDFEVFDRQMGKVNAFAATVEVKRDDAAFTYENTTDYITIRFDIRKPKRKKSMPILVDDILKKINSCPVCDTKLNEPASGSIEKVCSNYCGSFKLSSIHEDGRIGVVFTMNKTLARS